MRNDMFIGRHRMDFLKTVFLVVLLAFTLTITLHAGAVAAAENTDQRVVSNNLRGCGLTPVSINGRGGLTTLDSDSRKKAGIKGCRATSPSALFLGLLAASMR